MSITRPHALIRFARFLLHLKPATTSATKLPAAPTKSAHFPKVAHLAGVPLHILHSERADPGALLRDWLLHQPSDRDG